MPLSEKNLLRVAIVGFGNHVVKDILSCFTRDSEMEIARIYDVRTPAKFEIAFPAFAAMFTDALDDILSDATIDVVYIATPIAFHFDYACAALRAGKHVWCEKPLTESLKRTRILVALAQERTLFLGEVSMYQHHRQFSWLKQEIADRQAAGERFIGARARFSIPELAPTNFRYSKDLGGGALLDVGYYPLSMAAGLFGLPQDLLANGFVSVLLGVDLSGVALLSYAGFGFQCMWAIGSSYFNEAEFSFSKSTLTIPRAFSKPADLATKVQVTGNFGQPEDPIEIPADDQFANMFSAFATATRMRDPAGFASYAEKCVMNATLLDSVQGQIENSAAKQSGARHNGA